MRLVTGIIAGAVIGTAASMMMPEVNRRTRKMVNKTRRRMTHAAEDIFDDLKGYIR